MKTYSKITQLIFTFILAGCNATFENNLEGTEQTTLLLPLQTNHYDTFDSLHRSDSCTYSYNPETHGFEFNDTISYTNIIESGIYTVWFNEEGQEIRRRDIPRYTNATFKYTETEQIWENGMKVSQITTAFLNNGETRIVHKSGKWGFPEVSTMLRIEPDSVYYSEETQYYSYTFNENTLISCKTTNNQNDSANTISYSTSIDGEYFTISPSPYLGDSCTITLDAFNNTSSRRIYHSNTISAGNNGTYTDIVSISEYYSTLNERGQLTSYSIAQNGEIQTEYGIEYISLDIEKSKLGYVQ